MRLKKVKKENEESSLYGWLEYMDDNFVPIVEMDSEKSEKALINLERSVRKLKVDLKYEQREKRRLETDLKVLNIKIEERSNRIKILEQIHLKLNEKISLIKSSRKD